jgi:hypothetical protein
MFITPQIHLHGIVAESHTSNYHYYRCLSQQAKKSPTTATTTDNTLQIAAIFPVSHPLPPLSPDPVAPVGDSVSVECIVTGAKVDVVEEFSYFCVSTPNDQAPSKFMLLMNATVTAAATGKIRTHSLVTAVRIDDE